MTFVAKYSSLRKYNSLSRDNPIYQVWRQMRYRCNKQGHPDYRHYGGRGIKVCKRWANSFAAFEQDMGPRPPGTLLDRRDNDGNYKPSNCRWATPAVSQRNSRLPRWVIFKGERMCITDIRRRTGWAILTIKQRLGLPLRREAA